LLSNTHGSVFITNLVSEPVLGGFVAIAIADEDVQVRADMGA